MDSRKRKVNGTLKPPSDMSKINIKSKSTPKEIYIIDDQQERRGQQQSPMKSTKDDCKRL